MNEKRQTREPGAEGVVWRTMSACVLKRYMSDVYHNHKNHTEVLLY